ncbi:asparagine synthase C-terminal domain-containing protein [Streptomyces murinus]|uniref:asparagine synthase (glutamine-hydrolyzing) n=1 Tax=Streptomyces murinus TaxID=33900 RepID=A0A7W3NKA9_STRMR|nr:asparagine synthase C-terminal domain-containing protein [Streptomyces murinus]MBA9052086.1 asparagine synthetase B (glutamine-hydrolyzing) [Streptomyces murinus]
MVGHYADTYREAVAQVPHQAGESPDEARMRTIGHLTLTRWLPTLLDRGDRLSMAHGRELRVPYADHRLVEYLSNTPWSFKTFDGQEKSLLRAVAQDRCRPRYWSARRAPGRSPRIRRTPECSTQSWRP